LGYLLAREGMTPNHKKLLRIHLEENLQLRRAAAANARWHHVADDAARTAEPALVARVERKRPSSGHYESVSDT